MRRRRVPLRRARRGPRAQGLLAAAVPVRAHALSRVIRAFARRPRQRGAVLRGACATRRRFEASGEPGRRGSAATATARGAIADDEARLATVVCGCRNAQARLSTPVAGRRQRLAVGGRRRGRRGKRKASNFTLPLPLPFNFFFRRRSSAAHASRAARDPRIQPIPPDQQNRRDENEVACRHRVWLRRASACMSFSTLPRRRQIVHT